MTFKRGIYIVSTAMAMATGTAWGVNPIFDAGPGQPGHFGIRAGMEMTAPSDEGDNTQVYRNGVGAVVNVIWNKPVWQNMYIEPSVGAFYNTIRFKDMFDPDFSGTEYPETNTSGSIRNAGLRVGLMIGYRFDFTEDIAISLFTGPRFDYGLYAHQTFTEEIDGVSTSVDRDMYDGQSHMRRCDAQWAFGIGITYRKHYYAQLDGAAALTNLLTGPLYANTTLHRNSFAVRIGYNF